MSLAATTRSETDDTAMPIEGRCIVCFASNWDVDPTSKHHLMRILSRRNNVLWVNYHGSRRPRLNSRDVGSTIGTLRRVARGIRPISPTMAQFTPLLLPGVKGPAMTAINRRLVAGQVRKALAACRAPGQPVQVWTFAPDVAYLAGAFDEECLVYYCVDDFSQFEGFDADATLRAELELIGAADVVLTTSCALYESRAALHPRVHLVRHGVDYAHFARALQAPPPPPEPIRNIRRPTAGFIGLMRDWIDVRLLAAVARRLPDVSFVMVGERQVEAGPLMTLPNVHFVGRQPYESLPAYCASFDVGLIPFVRSPMTEKVNPIKLREYLAAGLPVVSTNLPEVRPFAPDVVVADDADGFASACRTAIEESTPESRAARSALVADQDWESVTLRVANIVSDAMCRRAPQGAAWEPSRSAAPAAFTS